MKHTLAKIILVSNVIELIASRYNVNLDEARDMFYKSKLSLLLDDDSLGLYGESPLYLFSMFEQLYNPKN